MINSKIFFIIIISLFSGSVKCKIAHREGDFTAFVYEDSPNCYTGIYAKKEVCNGTINEEACRNSLKKLMHKFFDILIEDQKKRDKIEKMKNNSRFSIEANEMPLKAEEVDAIYKSINALVNGNVKVQYNLSTGQFDFILKRSKILDNILADLFD